MSVIIGSARIDENGHAHGGKAGDQKQTSKPDYKGEVSMQEFYVSTKGWYIFRAKSSDHANGLAKAMKTACNNANIGYDQWQRDNIIKDHTDSKKKTECDCSSLVRECIIEATGKDPGNIRTVDMPVLLPKTGLFQDKITYKAGTTLYTGDILVTKTSGHTVIVVDGKDRNGKVLLPIAQPTLKAGNVNKEVKVLQKDLNWTKSRDENGNKLEVDGEYGRHTRAAVMNFQKTYKLEVDGIYGPLTAKKMDKVLNG